MLLTVEHEGRKTVNITATEAVEMGYPAAIVGAAAKRTAKSEVAQVANAYRAKLASTSAGKLQAYRIKEEIARDPANADAAELALIDREATARGIPRDDLIALIAAQATAYRQIALLIEALEAEAGAAISAIADDADDIEAQIVAGLEAAKAEAETEYQNALALMAGA